MGRNVMLGQGEGGRRVTLDVQDNGRRVTLHPMQEGRPVHLSPAEETEKSNKIGGVVQYIRKKIPWILLACALLHSSSKPTELQAPIPIESPDPRPDMIPDPIIPTELQAPTPVPAPDKLPPTESERAIEHYFENNSIVIIWQDRSGSMRSYNGYFQLFLQKFQEQILNRSSSDNIAFYSLGFDENTSVLRGRNDPALIEGWGAENISTAFTDLQSTVSKLQSENPNMKIKVLYVGDAGNVGWSPSVNDGINTMRKSGVNINAVVIGDLYLYEDFYKTLTKENGDVRSIIKKLEDNGEIPTGIIFTE